MPTILKVLPALISMDPEWKTLIGDFKMNGKHLIGLPLHVFEGHRIDDLLPTHLWCAEHCLGDWISLTDTTTCRHLREDLMANQVQFRTSFGQLSSTPVIQRLTYYKDGEPWTAFIFQEEQDAIYFRLVHDSLAPFGGDLECWTGA